MVRSRRGWALVGAALALAAGCGGEQSKFFGEAPAAAQVKPENGGTASPAEDWSTVPVPPADGPRLAPIAMKVPVYAVPDRAKEPIGYLRVGARVARSAEPVTRRDCPDGWYAIRPLGFVCAGAEATVDENNPIAKAMQVEPDRRRAMPYKYAFTRSIAPNYMRVPTKDEQFQYEMRLERHLRSWAKLRDKWDVLDVGSNDVPLDEQGLAVGKIPDDAVPMDLSVRFGGDGHDEVPWWLVGERKIPNLSSFRAPPYAIIANRVKRHGGVALVGTFVAGPEAQGRRFAISTDARLIPADKLKADSGSPFHGYSVRELGLPVAFGHQVGAFYWNARGGGVVKDGLLAWRELVPLTGTLKEIQGTLFAETRDGRWVKKDDILSAAKPSKLPSWARGKFKWIDISIVSQTLTLWEGDRPVYVTLVSTGRDGLGEPGKTLSTPRGNFYVYQKHVTTTMDSEVADHNFELRDVPWVMYFKGGYALHGAYWHNDFGKVRSHGCVNLAPIDARYVFFWATPQVPDHWHAAYVGDQTEPGTLVNIHP